LLVFLSLAWLVSENRRLFPIREVIVGLSLQFVLAVTLLKIPAIQTLFSQLNRLILALEESTMAGTSMVFGYLGGAAPPFEEIDQAASYILAFRALPLILIISALSSLLFYWGIMPLIVRGFSRLLENTLRLGGAEGLGVSANIFLGMVESPLFVKPYLKQMSRSELFSLMTCGMATIAGTVMVLYATFLENVIPNALGHILTASLISAPAGVTMAKIMIPQTSHPTPGELVAPVQAQGSMDAITRGTLEGMKLIINISAMLIVLVALVHLINLALGLLPGQSITLQQLLGYVMAPIVWLMGIPWGEAKLAGSLMGTKTVLNELIAYFELSQIPQGSLSSRSVLILSYALCGFANPGSLGIMIGGLGTMVPEKRTEIVALGAKCILSGTLATCMTGAVVGILY
jgi:CNT family concentrative nucleoside transporter